MLNHPNLPPTFSWKQSTLPTISAHKNRKVYPDFTKTKANGLHFLKYKRTFCDFIWYLETNDEIVAQHSSFS